MADDDLKARAIPRGRLARFGAFGRLATGVAGGMVAEGARRLADGQRPRMSELILTPGNMGRVADQLSHLRGAAMKLGQMISMDAGDMLPAELSAIMARLRDRAHRMPPAQLQQVLAKEWGPDWRKRFQRFEAGPIAAASIGQVHRATAPDGRLLAVKVQYPGVAESIDADVDNVATLLRVSGLLPAGLDLAPLLATAKTQLKEEADYVREGAQLERFRALLAGDERFVVPALAPEFSSRNVLAMDFVDAQPIESLEQADQDTRDRVMTTLIGLVLREMFAFGWMQTDPNFANYRYQPATGRLVLLDFGATRAVAPAMADAYRVLLRAGLDGDRDRMRNAALGAGFVSAAAIERHQPVIDRILEVILTQFARSDRFDFGDRSFVAAIRDEAIAMAQDRAIWHVPPTEMLFLQRKISGTALLAARLKARVDLRALVEQFISTKARLPGLEPGLG